MKHRKIRTYPPFIVAMLTLVLAAALGGYTVIEQGIKAAASAFEVPPATASIALATPGADSEPPAPATQPEPTYPSMIHSLDFDGEDAEMLMKIAMAEAEGESVEGKALVMLVVLNRVWSDEFPDSIEEVLFQKKQFSPVREGGRYYTTEPNDGCREALDLVMSGWDESQGALYFERASNGEGWHSRNLEFLFQYGGHKFYR